MGTLDAHSIQIGTNPSISLSKIPPQKFPFGKDKPCRNGRRHHGPLAPIVEQLGNIKLAAVYQSSTSGEMSLLQEGLLQEIRTNPGNRDAKAMAANLFNLETLVLKETATAWPWAAGCPARNGCVRCLKPTSAAPSKWSIMRRT